MNKLTQEMIDAGATALCGLVRAQATDQIKMKRFNDACEKAQWLWTLMTAAAPKGSQDEPTLRDRFAMGIAAGDAASDEGWGIALSDDKIAPRVALYYQIADVMMRERAK